jgi:hypothetical protein
MQNLQSEIKMGKTQATEIIKQNEELQTAYSSHKSEMENVTKKILKMHAKLGKFSKQIAKVENLPGKYKYLHQLTEDHSLTTANTPIYAVLENVSACVELIKSQMKHQIIANEALESEESYFDVKLDLIKQDKVPQREAKRARDEIIAG